MGGGHDSEDPKAGCVKRLYDRLETILRGLKPDRQEAFRDHLREQNEADDGKEDPEADSSDDHGATQGGDH